MDKAEPGEVDKVGISQDIFFPAGSMDKVTTVETNAAGETVYKDLQPGIYYIAYMESTGITSKLTVEISLSSEQEAQVAFGIAPEF